LGIALKKAELQRKQTHRFERPFLTVMDYESVVVTKGMSKNAIVIGASSGIGFALTQALLERSFTVGACSRLGVPADFAKEIL
jgi:hypothetical protein